MTRTERRSRRAFSLIEATLSVLIVGGLLAAALSTTGAAAVRRRAEADRARAALLAQDLLAEILAADYADSDAGPDSFGLPLDEVGDGSRALFDDVDDYDGWQAGPPQRKDGTELPGLSGWNRRVWVNWAPPDDLDAQGGANTGLKRIRVSVFRGDALLATADALRSQGLDDTQGDAP